MKNWLRKLFKTWIEEYVKAIYEAQRNQNGLGNIGDAAKKEFEQTYVFDFLNLERTYPF